MKLLVQLKEETMHRIQFQKLYTRAMEQNEEQYKAITWQKNEIVELQADKFYLQNDKWCEPSKEDRKEERRVLKEFQKMIRLQK